MALKRINKELTDLGRYVVPEVHFCSLIHLLRRGSAVPSFDGAHGGARSVGGAFDRNLEADHRRNQEDIYGRFCMIADC